MTKNVSFLLIVLVSMLVFLGFGAQQLDAQQYLGIYASYVDGFGSNHGWNDVDDAEGQPDGDYAWKYLDTDYYGRLLKAYDFESWTQTFPIERVVASVPLEVDDPNCIYNSPSWLNVQVRVYDGTNVIVSKTEAIACYYPDQSPIISVTVPKPIGGWTKAKVDSLEVWIGATERKDVDLKIDSVMLVVFSN